MIKKASLQITQVAIYLSLLFLLACAPAVTPPPSGLLATIVAATVQALPTNTPYPTATATLIPTRVRATATPPFTATPWITLTPFPSITFTPTLTETVTDVPIGVKVGKYQGRGNYACMIMGQKPDNWSKIRPDTLVYVTWSIKNVGGKDWQKGGLDIVFLKGSKLYEYGPSRELSFDIPVGDTRDIVIVIRTPKAGGDYQSFWGLKRGDNMFCELTFNVSVR